MSVGIFVGRFQPFHNGHLAAVRYALEKVDYLFIVVGSAQKSYERDNPFTAGERITMIKAAIDESGILPGKWMAIPLPDADAHSIWAATLRATVPKFDVAFTNDALTTALLKEEQAGIEVVAVPYLDRKNYSATNVRNGILEMKDWQKLVPPAVSTVVEKIGGIERVRNLIKKDLEGK